MGFCQAVCNVARVRGHGDHVEPAQLWGLVLCEPAVRKSAVLSDLLAPIETLDKHLGFLSAAGHEVVVFQVLDPAELSFEFKEASLFRDLESDQELYIDPELARKTYQEKFTTHNAAVKQTCERHGIQFHPVVSNQPMEFALFDFMRSRGQRARNVRRRVLR